MKCNYFGICGSCTLHDIEYENQIQNKASLVKKQFPLKIPLEVYQSKKSHFRNRAEFRIFHYGDNQISYAMHTNQHKIVPISHCSIVCSSIHKIMPILIDEISKNNILKQKLFSVEFLSSDTSKQTLITMIYHKRLCYKWEEEAKKLQSNINVFIVGRSRKQKIILSQDFIQEYLQINNKKYILNYYEASFTQPNTRVNEQMISFVKENTQHIGKDLLELYCGCGNFTMALSDNFEQILATEISKKSIYAAKQNREINNINNISLVRLSVEELVSAFKKERKFNRLKNIELFDFDFSSVLVDPPRSGLDDTTREFIKKFENIIYISCNISTLKIDISQLQNTHIIKKWGMFDQFAYTHHLETIMILKKI